MKTGALMFKTKQNIMEKLNAYMQGLLSRNVFHAASLHVPNVQMLGSGVGGRVKEGFKGLSDISILSKSVPCKFLLLAKISLINCNFPLLATLIPKNVIKQYSTFS